MTQRRSVAPDIVGCCLLLYAATLLFAVLRAPYYHRSVGDAALDMVVYGSLLLVCTLVAVGLFVRRRAALLPALVLSLAALCAGAMAYHVPDTAQLPAGILGATGLVLLIARRGELCYPVSSNREATSTGVRT
jgi:hypothetical protein